MYYNKICAHTTNNLASLNGHYSISIGVGVNKPSCCAPV